KHGRQEDDRGEQGSSAQQPGPCDPCGEHFRCEGTDGNGGHERGGREHARHKPERNTEGAQPCDAGVGRERFVLELDGERRSEERCRGRELEDGERSTEEAGKVDGEWTGARVAHSPGSGCKEYGES